MRRFFTIIFLIIATAGFGQSQNSDLVETEQYTLGECLKIGILNNYSLKIQRNKERISSNNASVGNAGFLPSLDASARYSGNAQSNETKLRSNNDIVQENGIFNQTIDAGINLNWTIFEGFNVTTTYKKLKELKSQGELETIIALENLVADISSEYYNYVQQKIRLNNLRYAVELSKERLRIVEQRYRIGNFSGLDYQQAKVDFNSDSSAFMKQQETVKTSAIVLNELMAVNNINFAINVADTSILVNKDLDLNKLLEETLAKNSLLLHAKRESHLAELDYKITNSSTYPYLRLNAGYGYTLNKYNKGANYHRGSMTTDFGLTLGINIFDGNNTRRLRRNAKINIENVKLQESDIEQSVKADLYKIWNAYQNNLQILTLEKENLITAKLNHEIAMERYMLGDLSGIEMREAQKSLLDAEERLLTARYNTKLCEISLMQISSRIMEYTEQ